MITDLDKSDGIALFTDGSAYTKDKSGGWAFIAIDAFDGEHQSFGGERNTTNNRMEMTAWIRGLQELYEALGPCEVIVYSDSEYVGLGATRPERNRKLNVDLWLELDESIASHTYVEWQYVRGHTGDYYNEAVDKLAGEARVAFNYDRSVT